MKDQGTTRGANKRQKGWGSAALCLGLCLALLMVSLLATSPWGQHDASAGVESGLKGLLSGKPQAPAEPSLEELYALVDPCWHPLMERLKADDMYGADVAHWFADMPDVYSPRPMGVKVSVLFKKRFIPPYFPYFNKPVQPLDIYAGVVTKDNVKKCYEFLQEYAEIFKRAEEKYFVPKEVLVSLLMVETRLGTFMGNEQAFWSLSCMALAEEPQSIDNYLERLPVTEAHADWLDNILKARSQWAYTELKALILYCRLHEHDPLQIRGSIYGAIGICQFMPSNIAFYAVDGNGDGKIDLFSLEDAVPSAANFLKTHGWRKSSTRQKQVRLLKYYNHSTAYANTILGLSDGVVKLAKNEAKKATSTAKATPASSPDKKS